MSVERSRPRPVSARGLECGDEMGQGTKLLRRAFQLAVVMAALSMLIFVLARVMPGDAARVSLGPDAREEQVQELRERLGLNKPIYVQYYLFLKGLLGGQFGMSLVTRQDVGKDLLQRFPATVEVVVVAMFFSLLVGVPLGILAAVHKDKAIDQASRLFSFAGVSFPLFWVGIMFQLFIAYRIGLVPISGRLTGAPPTHVTGLYLVDSVVTGNWLAFADTVQHLVLPVLTLSLSPIAQITRLVRASMIEQLRKEYTVATRVIGMPENMNIYKYMLRNALTSVITIVGLMFGRMLGYSFVVEKVFAWPGMARYGVDAVVAKDFNAVIGVTLVVGVAFVLINLAVEALYAVADPRIRLRK